MDAKKLLEFCRRLEKRKTINYEISAYSLKHVAENIIGSYVSEQELIDCMEYLGFTLKKTRFPGNFFNVTKRSVAKESADYIQQCMGREDLNFRQIPGAETRHWGWSEYVHRCDVAHKARNVIKANLSRLFISGTKDVKP